ncbi:MAG: aquaporin, partial [Candidatus Sungbacteria bacterium]|nr:aquaporin [Candidatus Sungbacteria bacterium]
KEGRLMKEVSQGVAEFIGTFALILFGAGSIIATGGNNLVAIALAHGLTIAIFVSALGAISGAHFNPAVTIGLWIGKKIESNLAVAYIIAQLLGATAAALVLQNIFFPDVWQTAQLGTPMLASNVSWVRGAAIEALLTSFLMLTVYLTAVDSRAPKMGGLFIGLIITVDIFLGGSLTGAAMNPARTFGPAFAGWFGGAAYNPWAGHLVYWVGPGIGAAVATFVYKMWLSERT